MIETLTYRKGSGNEFWRNSLLPFGFTSLRCHRFVLYTILMLHRFGCADIWLSVFCLDAWVCAWHCLLQFCDRNFSLRNLSLSWMDSGTFQAETNRVVSATNTRRSSKTVLWRAIKLSFAPADRLRESQRAYIDYSSKCWFGDLTLVC